MARRPSKEAPGQVARVRSEGRLIGRRVTIAAGTVMPEDLPSSPTSLGLDKTPFPKVVAIPSRASVALLVAKHRLDFHEVQDIVRAFESAKPGCTAGGMPLSRETLEGGLGKIFDCAAVKPEIVDKVFANSSCDSGFDIDKFLEWYLLNMFTKVAAMRGDSEKVASDKLVYELAHKYDVPSITIDKMKQKFDFFDDDGSGRIDYDEFKKMIALILDARNIADISDDRVRKFFKEIDVDGSGEVDFEEFASWYLKYFNAAENGDDTMAGGKARILEQFYGSYDPTAQRTNALSKQIAAELGAEAAGA